MELSAVKKIIAQKTKDSLIHSIAQGKVVEDITGQKSFEINCSWGNITALGHQYSEVEEAPQEYFKGNLPGHLKEENQFLYPTHAALIAFFEGYGIPVEIGTKSQVLHSQNENFPPAPLDMYKFKIYPVEDFEDKNLHAIEKIAQDLRKAIAKQP